MTCSTIRRGWRVIGSKCGSFRFHQPVRGGDWPKHILCNYGACLCRVAGYAGFCSVLNFRGCRAGFAARRGAFRSRGTWLKRLGGNGLTSPPGLGWFQDIYSVRGASSTQEDSKAATASGLC